MIIVVDGEDPIRVTLRSAKEFQEFSVRFAGEISHLDKTLRDSGAGAFDGTHAWIEAGWIKTAAGAEATGDWFKGFADMLAYARDKGWVDSADGRIRAHVTNVG